MSRCPQCKTALPAPETEPIIAASRRSRSSRSAQQPAAKAPPPALTNPSKRTAPASSGSTSTRASKQLHPTSRTEQQARDPQQCTPVVRPAASSSRSYPTREVPVSTVQHESINSSDHPTVGPVTSSTVDSLEKPSTTSQPPSTHPTSTSTAGGRHQYTGELVDLDLPKQYKKSRSQNQDGRPPGGSSRHAEWMRSANIMLQEVPSGPHWREKLVRIDSSIIAAVAMDFAPAPRGDVSPTGDVERNGLIQLVRRFAERHSEGRVNFEQFILVCLCKVLSSQGVPQDKIVETLQICISDTSRKNIDRYLKGATWANMMMNELFFTEWGYRAVDLLAICEILRSSVGSSAELLNAGNRTIATYGRIATAPDSRQYFITDLTQRKYFEGYQELPDRRHDTIPWIVKKELGDGVSYVENSMKEKIRTYRRSYRDICEALGYGDEFFRKTEHLHSSSYPGPHINAGDSDDAGSSSQTSSFHTAKQSTISASSPQESTSAEQTPTTQRSNASYVQELSRLRRRPIHGASPDDAATRDPPTSQSAASQRTNRIVPDRSSRPLGDPEVVDRRRRQPHETPSFAELPSTSLGESAPPAPSTQSTKRPLPDSPTSASGPIDTTRRRQHVRERSSREKMGPSSHSGKKGSKDQRGRA